MDGLISGGVGAGGGLGGGFKVGFYSMQIIDSLKLVNIY